MSAERTIHRATYDYPGSFFPESTSRDLPAPTVEAALAAAPDEDGYFGRDGWYAVTITSKAEKVYRSDDGDERWVQQGDKVTVGKYVIGERIHWSEIEETDRNRILIANIKGNSRDGGYGVRTRCGNWQIASDFTAVLPESVTA